MCARPTIIVRILRIRIALLHDIFIIIILVIAYCGTPSPPSFEVFLRCEVFEGLLDFRGRISEVEVSSVE